MAGHTRSRNEMRSQSRRWVRGTTVLSVASALMFTVGGVVAAQPDSTTTPSATMTQSPTPSATTESPVRATTVSPQATPSATTSAVQPTDQTTSEEAVDPTQSSTGVAVPRPQSPNESVPTAPERVRPAELPAAPKGNEPVAPTDPALSSMTAEPDPDWKPTKSPKATVVPGQMRSDREEIPAGFTKEEADKAEQMEARLATMRVASGCQVYWPSPHAVCGAIRDKYNSLGGPASFLSFPNSPELTNPDGHGKRTQFLNGPIYWSAATGAHPVVNSFLNRWGVHGYEAGWLGYPKSDEIVHADGIGRHQEFQGGAIYVAFQNAIGSTIAGAIRDKWNEVGAETPGSLLGYPISDEIKLPDGQGRMNRFERGVIYWHPAHGAHPVVNPVLDIWGVYGFEKSRFGYPTGDPQVSDGNPWQQFQFDRMGVLQPEFINEENPPLYFELDRTNVSEDRIDEEGFMRVSAQWTQNSTDPNMVRPIAWGIKFLPPMYELGANGAATPTTCQGSITRNGAPDPWSYSKLGTDGGSLDYLFHGTMSKNSFDEEIAMKILCEFRGDFGRTMIADIRPYIMLRDRY